MNKLLKYYNLIIGIFWVLLFLTLWCQYAIRTSIWNSLLFTLGYIPVMFIITTVVSRVLLPRAFKTKRMAVFFVQAAVAILLLGIVLSIIISHSDPVEEEGDYVFILNMLGMLPTAFLLISGFCGFEFFKEFTKRERVHLEEQINFLQSQVNPHLIFNVLNHIHILMQKNVDLASDLLIQFSNVLRYMIYECNKDKVLLSKEMKYLQDVVDIERMRWGNELDVDCEWNIRDDDKTISPFLLITFVENAFKHVSRIPGKNGYVNISFRQKGDRLTMMIENSKAGQPSYKKESSGFGLQNIRLRLEILYSEQYDLEIHETENVYRVNLCVTL